MTDDPLPASLQLLQDEGFVRSRVWPLLAPAGGSPAEVPGLEVRVLRRQEERGRAVAEYSFDGRIRVIAKLYLDDVEGELAHRTHRTLWEQGFGSHSGHRVPELVAYLADVGVLLMRPVSGGRLRDLETRGGEAYEDALGRAARWLAALHTSRVRIGPRDDISQRALHLATRMPNAVACAPHLEDVIGRSLEELDTRCPPDSGPRSQVQTHGRYHAGHVYLDPEHVTVIDLDRVSVAHPGKDVGEFLHRMRWQAARAGISRETMDARSEAFVGGYVDAHPPGVAGLSFYWSYSILSTLISRACHDRRDRSRWQGRVAFLQAEFDHVPRRAAAWGGRAGR